MIPMMKQNKDSIKLIMVSVFVMTVLGLASCELRPAHSQEIVNTAILVEAIGISENSWNHKPYGIMKDYCSPKTVAKCKLGAEQTVNKWKEQLEYSSADEFIEKFAEIYAPTKGGKLRKAELEKNPNWARNVKYHYHKLNK